MFEVIIYAKFDCTFKRTSADTWHISIEAINRPCKYTCYHVLLLHCKLTLLDICEEKIYKVIETPCYSIFIQVAFISSKLPEHACYMEMVSAYYNSPGGIG